MRSVHAIIKYGLPVLAVLFSGALSVHADRYVATNGAASSGYASWDQAGSNIQTVLNAATPAETVWVSNGTYVINNQILVTNRSAALRSANGYTNTIVAMNWPAYSNRCFVVSNAILDGFTVSNGYFRGINSYSGGGGAYIIKTGTVRNCYFVNNICSNTGEYAGGGGAWVSNSLISNCIFYQNQSLRITDTNRAGFGGGIYCFKDSTIVDSTIVSNTAANSGGGICATDIVGTIVVSNCNIRYNAAFGGGGAYGAFLLFNNCVISNNTATSAGGGGITIVSPGGKVRNSIIAKNNSYTNAGGGAYIFLTGSLSNCVIFGNTNSGGGAGVYVFGGAGSTAVVDACRISNNLCRDATGGAGIAITNNGQIRNCLIANNTNMSPNGNGGGVLLANAGSNTNTAGLLNCTVANNYSTNEGGGIAALGPSNYIANCIFFTNASFSNNFPDVYNADGNSNNYWYCCANVPSAPLPAGQGNISSNPALAATWRLSGNSPCINAGINQTWMTNAVDLDGKARIRYGTVDMGAYERVNEATSYRFLQ